MIREIYRAIKNFNFTKAIVSRDKWEKIEASKNQKMIKKWKSGMLESPPHIIKQNVINDYQDRYKYEYFIETGTYMGEMVEAQKSNFKNIISIELSEELHRKAINKFKNDTHITILQGDSGKVLPKALEKINGPVIFWLDGHYSAGITAKGDKECPIYEEVDAIFNGKMYNHILLVDDARCFTGKGDYPTIDELTKYIKEKNSNYKVEVKDDVIRYTT